MRQRVRKLLPAAALLVALGLPTAALAAGDPPELRLVKALQAMQSGQSDKAFKAIEQLVHDQPNFKLAQLIYADMLRARSGAPQALGVESPNQRMQQLIAEARARWQERQSLLHGNRIPANVLRLAPGLRSVLVDLSGSRLYLLQGDGQGWARVVDSNYAGIGVAGFGKQVEGDGKTPVGLYEVTEFLPDSALASVYGAGALVLSYPNRIDVAHHRTGSGIWIHGVPPNTFTRAPRSSKGCVTLANRQLDQLRLTLGDASTVVVLSRQLQWITLPAARNQRTELVSSLWRWRDAMAEQDNAQLRQWYANDFSGGDDNPLIAIDRLRQTSTAHLQLQIDDLSVFHYPDEAGLYLLRFTLHYQAANSSGDLPVEQLWVQQGQYWRIRYEGRHALALMPAASP